MRPYMWLARSRPIRLLLLASGACGAGDLAAFTVASVYAYRAGGAGLVAVLGLLKALPGALLVPLVTSRADRMRRERLLIASVVPRVLLLGAAAAAMASGGQAVLVVVLVALEGGLASVFRQVQAALLPWLARTPEELTSANTAASVMESAATIGGPALAAGLLATGTALPAMLAACGLVAAGLGLLAAVRPASSQPPRQAAGGLPQLRRDLAAGFDAGVRRDGAVALFVPAAAQTFARGVLNVLIVVIAFDLFGLGSSGVGWLGALLGAGGILGGPLAVMLVHGRRVARCFAGGVAAWGVPLILLAFAHPRYWPYLAFVGIGVANVFDDVGAYSSLQRVIPSRLMGRALGVRWGVLLLSMGLGSAVTPLLLRACGARGTLVAAGVLLVVVAAGFWPAVTAIDHKFAVPGPDLALLRQVAFFRPLPIAIIEHLATELQLASYEPEEVVIREGDPGDRFYLIAKGQARASKDGQLLTEMRASDSFGEIALLRRVPRTATVTATSHLEVRTLSREEFLAAVTGNPESMGSADEVISTRLGTG